MVVNKDHLAQANKQSEGHQLKGATISWSSHLMLFPDLWPPHRHHPLRERGRCTGGSCLWAAVAAALVCGSLASFLSGCANDLGEASRHFRNIYFPCSWVTLQSLLFLDLSFMCAIIQHDLNLNVPTSRREKSVLEEVGCTRITFISFDVLLIWEGSNPLKPVITVFCRGKKEMKESTRQTSVIPFWRRFSIFPKKKKIILTF